MPFPPVPSPKPRHYPNQATETGGILFIFMKNISQLPGCINHSLTEKYILREKPH
jgi:hypothetical protein